MIKTSNKDQMKGLFTVNTVAYNYI